MEGKFNEEDLFQRIINYTKCLDEIIETYEKNGKNAKNMTESYENIYAEMNYENIYLDFEEYYGEPLVSICPCFTERFSMKTFEFNYQNFSPIKRRIHDAYLFLVCSMDRIQATTRKFNFPEDMRKKLMTDEPKSHIENLLKRVNAKKH